VWSPERWLQALRRPRPTLVVGARSLDLWLDDGRALRRLARQPLEAAVVDVAALTSSLRAIADKMPFNAPLTAVLESVWMPLLLVETGTQPLRRSALAALVRHRLALLYDEGSPAAQWDLRCDYAPGDSRALSYALAPHVRAALVEAGTAAGLTWRAIVPAFEWTRQRAAALHRAPTPAWWCCGEQDRWLLARCQRGRIVALNPGTAPVEQASELAALVDAERVRVGDDDAVLPPVLAWVWTAARLTPDARVDLLTFDDTRASGSLPAHAPVEQARHA